MAISGESENPNSPNRPDLETRLSGIGRTLNNIIDLAGDEIEKERQRFVGEGQLIRLFKEESRDLFDQRVTELLENHQKANQGGAVDISISRLRDRPLVHIVYSRELALGSSEKILPTGDLTVASIISACEAADFQGYIRSDFTNADPANLTPSDRTGLEQYFRKKVNSGSKAPVLVLDGYGKFAHESLGVVGHLPLIGVLNPFHEGPSVDMALARISGEQYHIDQIGVFSSDAVMANSDTDDFRSKGAIYNQPEFDPERVIKVALALDKAIIDTRAGKEVCIQAPYGFGKTTTLNTLRGVFFKGFEFGVVDPVDGELRRLVNVLDPRRGRPISVDGLTGKDTKILVVDEMGRTDENGQKAKEVIEQAKQSGIKVIGIYPGETAPTSGIEVIKIS